jgi:hypothetical protein
MAQTTRGSAYLLVGVGVGERPLPPRGGVVPAGALGPGILQCAAAGVPAGGRAPPAAVIVVASAQPSSAPASLLLQQVLGYLAVVAGVLVVAHQRQVEARLVVMASCSEKGKGGADGRRGRRREEEERELGEATRPDAGLGADEGLHAAHGEVHLPPHLVAAHQRLETHQAAQRAQGSPGLEPINKTWTDITCSLIYL